MALAANLGTAQFGEMKTKIQEAGSNLTERAKETASSVAERTREAASTVTQRAGEMAANVGQRAGEMAVNVGQRAEDATASVGSGIQALAGTIREKGPHGGRLGSASSAVADTLDRGGDYLQEEGLRGIGTDVTNLIRRNPIPALFVGIGIGFLLARAVSRR